MTLSLYVPGESPLHRLPPAPKLMALAALGVGLVLVDEPALLAGLAALAAGLVALARVPVAFLRAQLAGLAILVVLVALATGWLEGWRAGSAAGLRIAALVLLGLAVTLTTRTSDLMDTLERALAPLERRGVVDAGRVALAIALVLRFAPEILGEARAIREARAARGLRGGPVGLVVPLVVRTLASADAIAEAIDARGDGPPAARPTLEPHDSTRTEAP